MSDSRNLLQMKPILHLDHCLTMVEAARREATRCDAAVSIAVADDGGHILLLMRCDGATPMSAEVAPSKARLAATARRPTKTLEDAVNSGRQSLLSEPALNGMIEGGVPVKIGEQFIGAVGVSGTTPAQDTQIAEAAVAAFLKVVVLAE
ncbi:MAG: heme-binding protein [Flavobacteriaceae bacterium]